MHKQNNNKNQKVDKKEEQNVEQKEDQEFAGEIYEDFNIKDLVYDDFEKMKHDRDIRFNNNYNRSEIDEFMNKNLFRRNDY